MSFERFLTDNIERLPLKTVALINLNNAQGKKNEQIDELLGSTPVYLIKDQRLTKQSQVTVPKINVGENVFSVSTAIEEYARELKDIIAQKQTEAYGFSQQLESTFPERLIELKEVLSQTEFIERFQTLTEKQLQLRQFGISASIPKTTAYEGDNQRVLSVYLKDSEQKTSVFDGLLVQLNLFAKLLTEKEFTNKSIQFDNWRGFSFVSARQCGLKKGKEVK